MLDLERNDEQTREVQEGLARRILANHRERHVGVLIQRALLMDAEMESSFERDVAGRVKLVDRPGGVTARLRGHLGERNGVSLAADQSPEYESARADENVLLVEAGESRDAGADVFHCSQRRFWEPEFEGSDLNFAGWARKLTGKPTITVGSVGLSGEFIAAWSWIAALFAVACFLPNTQQIMARVTPALPAAVELVRGGWLGRLLTWRPSPVWAVASGVALAMGILSLSQVSEFLYFQF